MFGEGRVSERLLHKYELFRNPETRPGDPARVRVAARAGEPSAHTAPAELGANRVTSGQRNDHVDDHRQKPTQEELRIVLLRVDGLSLNPDDATPAAVRNC
jgi:hypothetical protein